jgi:hypothetical protein
VGMADLLDFMTLNRDARREVARVASLLMRRLDARSSGPLAVADSESDVELELRERLSVRSNLLHDLSDQFRESKRDRTLFAERSRVPV